ncbi:DNA excision repair protein ERCC-1 [Smittium culicis]|uniref:DNA excision repair protein ERCC-1 n=1 Tax=Smittium culicis TaxID=133412 RepID=A0A1R1XBX1_9FUNG|nr:DNA excision repair protein ERCC-1 [Smittium culicis]
MSKRNYELDLDDFDEGQLDSILEIIDENLVEPKNPNKDLASKETNRSNNTQSKENREQQYTHSASIAESNKKSESIHSQKKEIPKNFIPNQNNIVVNPVQKDNPVLKAIQKVAWEFDDIVPDYIVGSTSCILYLSI